MMSRLYAALVLGIQTHDVPMVTLYAEEHARVLAMTHTPEIIRCRPGGYPGFGVSAKNNALLY